MRSRAFSAPPVGRHPPGARPHVPKGNLRASPRTGSTGQEQSVAAGESGLSTLALTRARREAKPTRAHPLAQPVSNQGIKLSPYQFEAMRRVSATWGRAKAKHSL